ncbi:MAG: hypothetical protein JWQ13_2844 [Ramlibacter sp.]|jgi:uncharacterized membrane protein YcaP (DUF421 family)|nr:hypothetical protein [Ramlibacter sp.]
MQDFASLFGRLRMRGAGIERLDQVKLAVMESSGEISVIRDRN